MRKTGHFMHKHLNMGKKKAKPVNQLEITVRDAGQIVTTNQSSADSMVKEIRVDLNALVKSKDMYEFVGHLGNLVRTVDNKFVQSLIPSVLKALVEAEHIDATDGEIVLVSLYCFFQNYPHIYI